MKLSFVIVTHNAEKYIENCLDSVFAALTEVSSFGVEGEVLVADNASTDSTVHLAQKKHNSVTLIEHTTNQGFATAANNALKCASGTLIIFIDPRAVILSGSLRRMLEYMDINPQCAVVGGKIVDKKGITVCGARRFPGMLSKLTEAWGLDLLAPTSVLNAAAYGNKRFDRPTDVDWVPFTFACVRAEIFHTLGLFDARFYDNFADTDICRRITRARYPLWKIVYVPQARAGLLDGFAMKPEKDDLQLRGECAVRNRVRCEMLYVWKYYCPLTVLANTAIDLTAHTVRFCSNSLPVLGNSAKKHYNLVVIRETIRAMLDTQLGTQYPVTNWK